MVVASLAQESRDAVAQEDADVFHRFDEVLAISAWRVGSAQSDGLELEPKMDEQTISPVEMTEREWIDVFTLRMARVVRSLGGSYDDAWRFQVDASSRFQAFLSAKEYADGGVVRTMTRFFDVVESVCGELRANALGAMIPVPTDVFDHPAASGEYFTTLAREYVTARTRGRAEIFRVPVSTDYPRRGRGAAARPAFAEYPRRRRRGRGAAARRHRGRPPRNNT